MKSQEFDVGDEVEVTARMKDTSTGELIDPAVVACKVKDPQGVETTAVVERVSLGVFKAAILIDPDVDGVEGRWHWRIEALGPRGASEGHFVVRDSAFY